MRADREHRAPDSDADHRGRRITREQRGAMMEIFTSLAERDIRYVVLRGHETLPSSVQGSDIDLFVDPTSYDDALPVFTRHFEPAESILAGVLELAALGVTHPRRAVELAVGSPRDVADFVKKSLTTNDFSSRQYVERTFSDGSLTFHLVNHLAYTSPMYGSQIRVDPEVEAAILERRVERDGFYIPSKPDELAHLVCRGVFDYHGEFPARYRSRCDELFEAVRSREDLDEQFSTLLSRLFYDADSVVYQSVSAGEYDAILSRLRQYADY